MKSNPKTKYVEIPASDAEGADTAGEAGGANAKGADRKAGAAGAQAADETGRAGGKSGGTDGSTDASCVASYLLNEGAKFDEHDLVSVIVPIFNAGDYLAPCLESILAQTHTNLEIICLNDGSTDDSLSVMREFAEKDGRIRVIDKENQGYGATCNRGLDEAHGTWIAIVEPDDWIESGMYAEMLAEASRYTTSGRIDVIKTPYWRIVMPDTPEQRKLNCSFRHRIKPRRQPFLIAETPHLLTHHPSIWSALYRKDFLEEFAIRFEPIPGAGWADNPFLIDTLMQARGIVYADKPYYCYREETPAKAHDAAVRQPLLPFDRWNDMMDRLERLGVTDESVLRAHYSRGFTYMSGVLQEVEPETPGVDEAVKAMFKRMRPDLVLSDPGISPGCKELFCRYRGIKDGRYAKLPYYAGLVGEGFYFLRNIGPKQTLNLTRDYFKKRAKREGRE